MIRFISALGVCLLCLNSCSEAEAPPMNHEIDGRWSVLDVHSMGDSLLLESELHLWLIDTEGQKLTIENELNPKPSILPESGEYSLMVSTNTVMTLDIDFEYYFEGGYLFLRNQEGADEMRYQLVRQ